MTPHVITKMSCSDLEQYKYRRRSEWQIHKAFTNDTNVMNGIKGYDFSAHLIPLYMPEGTGMFAFLAITEA